MNRYMQTFPDAQDTHSASKVSKQLITSNNVTAIKIHSQTKSNSFTKTQPPKQGCQVCSFPTELGYFETIGKLSLQDKNNAFLNLWVFIN